VIKIKYPDIKDIEINPLVVYEQEEDVKAVGIRILLSSDWRGDING